MPELDEETATSEEDSNGVEIPTIAVKQLFLLVSNIAKAYRNNPFHNFEHASHVTMSVNKLLSRIVAPDVDGPEDLAKSQEAIAHEHLFGITSDPLTRFACVFSALIHDIDHPGIPNQQLNRENAYIATYYRGKSAAEQNSIDVGTSNYKEGIRVLPDLSHFFFVSSFRSYSVEDAHGGRLQGSASSNLQR